MICSSLNRLLRIIRLLATDSTSDRGQKRGRVSRNTATSIRNGGQQLSYIEPGNAICGLRVEARPCLCEIAPRFFQRLRALLLFRIAFNEPLAQPRERED